MKKLIGLGLAVLVNVVLFSALLAETEPLPQGEVHVTQLYGNR